MLSGWLTLPEIPAAFVTPEYPPRHFHSKINGLIPGGGDPIAAWARNLPSDNPAAVSGRCFPGTCCSYKMLVDSKLFLLQKVRIAIRGQ
jgi:hypothetical protein